MIRLKACPARFFVSVRSVLSHCLLEISGMATFPSHTFSVGLLCVLVSVSGYEYRPCLDRYLVVGARYDLSTEKFTGYVSLDNTFPVIEIENETVGHVFPQVRLDDVRLEINVTKNQKDFIRSLCQLVSDASGCSVVYDCHFTESSCDVMCMFGKKYVKRIQGRATSSDVTDRRVLDLCAKGYGLSTLHDAWKDILGYWQRLCAYFEARKERMTVSFRYDSSRRLVLCTVSLEDPIICRAIIKNEAHRDVAGPVFCTWRGDVGSGLVLEYPIEMDHDVVLTCFVSSDFIEKRVSLRVSNRTYSPTPGLSEELSSEDGSAEGPAESTTRHDANLSLVVGLPCAIFLASAVAVLLFRKRLGLRVCERTFSRVAYRTAGGYE